MEKHNIHVDISEAYRYMGGIGTPSDEVASELQRAALMVEENVSPRYVIKLCEIVRNSGILLKDTNLSFVGKSISALLHDCEQCLIFCATIGSKIETAIRKWQLKDTTFAAMLDACASSAVENLCDQIEAELKIEYSEQELNLTDRFSPGYGDLPLSIQPQFCATLDTQRKIGVVVGEDLMMRPCKSVTAIIGLSKSQQRHYDLGCKDCEHIKSCKFREKGVTCYGRAI